ncbi:hypothetical protein [Isoalcanivorax indicus]|uniref:hypothetical protein n=1 Tax=Isoalcanivorax indicus TaxID=2202653 RepID=UPI0013C4FC43|nr:hypothetical protein [Isoalcanivorax indicus]
MLAGCATPEGERGFYAYMDEQGNLVSGEVERPAARSRPDAPAAPEADEAALDAVREDKATGENQTPEGVDDSDRFITWYDAEGRLIREPVDFVAARKAASERDPGFQEIEDPADQEGGFIETVTPISAACCRALPEQARDLRGGRELLLRFAPGAAPQLQVGEQQHPAQVVRLAEDVMAVEVISYKGRDGYVHPQILVLDEQATPVLQVNNVFTRRYPETWSRYGFITGTLPREAGQRYLVVYIGYSDDQTPGFVPETDSPLRTQGEVLLRGVRRR